VECPSHRLDIHETHRHEGPVIADTADPILAAHDLQPIPLAVLAPGMPSPMALYLRLDSESVLCRRGGEMLDLDLCRQLFEAGSDLVWIRRSDRRCYQRYLKEAVLGHWQHGPDSDDSIESSHQSGEGPLPLVLDLLESTLRADPDAHDRNWRIAHYGARLADGMGVAQPRLLQDVICGLLLHELFRTDSARSMAPALSGGALAIIEGWKERIDGAGQLGWGPERMTIGVRIACVAIAFDQRTSGDGGRPRQRAFDVLREFIISEHGALDPTVIAAFIRMLDH
jgi:hypothetical protein